jgi:hypothetical protein
MRDSKSLTESRYHQIEDCDSIDDQTRAATRLVLCGNAESAREADEWMRMLGVHPSQADDTIYLTGPNDIPNTAIV